MLCSRDGTWLVISGLIWTHFSVSLRMLPKSNFLGNMPLFFRYSGVNATNAANFRANMLTPLYPQRPPLTPLYQQGPPLTPLYRQEPAVNAVIPGKTYVCKKT